MKEGKKLFLKSFDKSYIMSKPQVKKEMRLMKKMNAYESKKIYLDEKVFEDDGGEIKVGYLNINGLKDGGNRRYLDQDKNLIHLDMLALAETKLSCQKSSNDLFEYWRIIDRFDAEDERKHRGMMLIVPKEKESCVTTIVQEALTRNEKLQLKITKVLLANNLNFVFVYSRTTPTLTNIRTWKN